MFGRFGADQSPEVVGPKGFDDYELRLGDLMRGERATLGKSLLDVERDLRIKASYLAGIENGDLSAFDAPSFVAGYVRSYARFLGLDGDSCFAQFCAETGFVPAHGLSPAASTAALVAHRAKSGNAMGGTAFASGGFSGGLQPPSGLFGRIEPGALGSIAVLVAVVVGLGIGGMAILREVQKVQLAPVDQAPVIVADAPVPMALPTRPDLTQPMTALDPVAMASPVRNGPQLPGAVGDERGARSAQPAPLSVPILIARDGPISAIDPRGAGVLATLAEPPPEEVVQVVEAPKLVEILAVRPSWISVTAADGTVLFEKILDAGERYAVPDLDVAPKLRAGNSSAVYFVLDGKTYGPASTGPEVVRNLDLSAQAVQTAFALADPARDADLTAYVAEAGAAAP